MIIFVICSLAITRSGLWGQVRVRVPSVTLVLLCGASCLLTCSQSQLCPHLGAGYSCMYMISHYVCVCECVWHWLRLLIVLIFLFFGSVFYVFRFVFIFLCFTCNEMCSINKTTITITGVRPLRAPKAGQLGFDLVTAKGTSYDSYNFKTKTI